MTDCMVVAAAATPPAVVVSDNYCFVARAVVKSINDARRANPSMGPGTELIPEYYYKDDLGEHVVFSNGKDFIARAGEGLIPYK